jgi:hypothetical protein
MSSSASWVSTRIDSRSAHELRTITRGEPRFGSPQEAVRSRVTHGEAALDPQAFEFKRRAGEVAVRRWATARALQAPLCVPLAQQRTAVPRTAFPLTATISHPP